MNDLSDQWDTREAIRAKAQKKADEKAGPCPNCGAPCHVDLIDASWPSEWRYIPGYVYCTARCYEADPDAYLAALQRKRNA